MQPLPQTLDRVNGVIMLSRYVFYLPREFDARNIRHRLLTSTVKGGINTLVLTSLIT